PNNTYSGGASKIFEKFQYNDKRTADTNNQNSTTPFYNQSCGLDANFNCTHVQVLPTLNLNRVYVLTSGNTCSASESVVNSLRGVNVTVNLVGTTTCGKPYGFTAHDNCGVSYFPIEFKGTNNVGFGDYSDGFTPSCTAADDLSHALGDTAEGKLAAALYMRAYNGACTPIASASGTTKGIQSVRDAIVADGLLLRSNPTLENRIFLPLKR
ncbi:MAG TPA: peptidase S41, partial [Methylibium sp.]